MRKKDQVVGIPEGEFKEEAMKAIDYENAQKSLDVMEALDRIPVPIESTIYIHGNKNVYLNEKYRDMVSQKDLESKRYLQKLLKNRKKVVK